jgi:hypothetical protein
MWLALLKKALPYAIGAGVVIYVCFRIYEAGRLAERAEWEPRLRAAEDEVLKANVQAQEREELSRKLTAESDTRYADTIFRLNEQRIDASRDIRALSVRIATLASSVEQMSAVSGSAGSIDGTTRERIEERALGASNRFTRVGGSCEIVAAQLEELQRWVHAQQLIYTERLP